MLNEEVLFMSTCRPVPWLDKTWQVCHRRIQGLTEPGLAFAWVRKLFIGRTFGLALGELEAGR